LLTRRHKSEKESQLKRKRRREMSAELGEEKEGGVRSSSKTTFSEQFPGDAYTSRAEPRYLKNESKGAGGAKGRKPVALTHD